LCTPSVEDDSLQLLLYDLWGSNPNSGCGMLGKDCLVLNDT
jgi:hypothetical protein